MAKSSSSRLASPAEVAKRLAAERDKASRAPEILSRLADLLSELEKQRGDIQGLPFGELTEMLSQLREDLTPFDYSGNLETLANGTAEILEALEQQRKLISDGLSDAIDVLVQLSQQKPAELPPMPPDVRPDIAAIARKLEEMPSLQVSDEPQPTIFPSFNFSNITRDENGDIATATVDPVTKH